MNAIVSKSLVRTLYDIQSERIQTGNRICAEIKSRLGQKPGMSEAALAKEAKEFLAQAREEYARITDAFVLNQAHKYLKVDYDPYAIITDAGMLVFVELYEDQLAHEEKMAKVVAKIVAQHPLWSAFLEGVAGCGPLMSAVILCEFDIHKAERISQFWAYAGLDVAPDGRGRGRHKEHLVEQTYKDKEGKEKTKLGITFNPFLKTKLVGVLAGCLIKQVEWAPCSQATYDMAAEGRRKMKKDKVTQIMVPHIIIHEGHYRLVYLNYKYRLEHHKVYGVKNDEARKVEMQARTGNKYAPVGHRNNMALRYMIKIFLQDLWRAWRELEQLPITQPYHEAVLGHTHHSRQETHNERVYPQVGETHESEVNQDLGATHSPQVRQAG